MEWLLGHFLHLWTITVAEYKSGKLLVGKISVRYSSTRGCTKLLHVTDKGQMAAGLFTELLGSVHPTHLHRGCSHFLRCLQTFLKQVPFRVQWRLHLDSENIEYLDLWTWEKLGVSLGVLLWQKIAAALLPNGPGSSWCEYNRIFTWLGIESWSWYEKSVSELRVDTGVPLTHRARTNKAMTYSQKSYSLV